MNRIDGPGVEVPFGARSSVHDAIAALPIVRAVVAGDSIVPRPIDFEVCGRARDKRRWSGRGPGLRARSR